ncbi:hypothetical protein SISNIDRAFT_546227 [Sistotremastrum niveocremeum HHB9708]|uniref:Uncharacterized protein n=1 Tax=Sistotremastrum niveocremeum HHB9708 TaxID=1314777 RepID=A0A164ZYH3_9AGAM|nr:hypothetical protein SISNIDRAFT_546227 [Sistotremastrum niveocremeum HHB9708]
MMHPPRTSTVTEIFTDAAAPRPEFEFMTENRETGPPRAHFADGPTFWSPPRPKLHRSKTQESGGSGSSGSRTSKDRHKRSHGSGSASILSAMLDDDNRQSEQLRGALVITREKLEIETHRADNAELRAETAEAKLRQSEARATNAERARRTLEIEDARTREEIKRLRQQLDNAHREIRRAQSFIDELAEARNKAELAAHKNRETARGYQLALREREMLEQGREEGRRLGMQKGYREGRLRGWEEGREEGWEEGLEEGREGSAEGVVKGRVDGWRAGLDRGQSIGKAQVWKAGQRDGREEERRQAVDAFDKYMDNEPVGPQLGDSDEQSPERNARNHSSWIYYPEPETIISDPESPQSSSSQSLWEQGSPERGAVPAHEVN